MSILNNNNESMDKMVFENRNKSYGAYELRASYNGNAIKSTLITGGTFLALAMILLLLSGGKAPVEDILPSPVDPGKLLSATVVDMTPAEKPKQKAAGGAAAYKAADIGKISNTAIDSAVTKTQDNLTAVTGISSNANANGNSKKDTTVFVDPGTGTGSGPGTATVTTQPVLLWAETMPAFKGDMAKFIRDNVVFPDAALDEGVNAAVYVQFIVDVDGTVTNVKAANRIGYGCDEEAVRVVSKMPAWEPGKMGKTPVRVQYNIPIKFKSK